MSASASRSSGRPDVRPTGRPDGRPDGWPADLPPPEHAEFDDAVVAWLFELTPPDYRLHQVLRRYPAALARMARQHVAAELTAAREGYRTARYELREVIPPHGLEAVLEAYRHEGRRLSAAAKGVAAVEAVLRSRTGTPGAKEDTAAPGSRAG